MFTIISRYSCQAKIICWHWLNGSVIGQLISTVSDFVRGSVSAPPLSSALLSFSGISPLHSLSPPSPPSQTDPHCSPIPFLPLSVSPTYLQPVSQCLCSHISNPVICSHFCMTKSAAALSRLCKGPLASLQLIMSAISAFHRTNHDKWGLSRVIHFLHVIPIAFHVSHAG